MLKKILRSNLLWVVICTASLMSLVFVTYPENKIIEIVIKLILSIPAWLCLLRDFGMLKWSQPIKKTKDM